MAISVEVTMDAPLETVWQVCTDIEHCAEYIEDIVNTTIVEGKGKPFDAGLTWDETRVAFGSQHTERMWVENVTENLSYVVGAESCGAKYTTVFEFEKMSSNQTLVRCSFSAKPLSWCAWVMSIVMAPICNSMLKNCTLKDLQNIQAEAEKRMKDK